MRKVLQEHVCIWREKRMKKRCSNKGFSLVELIIVIAIMAI
ncbi:MAG: type II secretion system protein, partial [Lachnospiraceae bacterium]|nr:type II secretion system protein [Lachnospiraceae bacterium]